MIPLKVLFIATLLPAAAPNAVLPASALDAASHSSLEQALTKDPSRFGLEPTDQLTSVKVISLRNGAVVRAHRVHQGLRVLDQSMSVRLDATGQVARINSDFSPIKLATTTPTVSKKDAQLTALREVRGLSLPANLATGAGPQTALIISARFATIVWAVNLPGLTPEQHRVALIDALTGELLESRSLVRYASAPGLAYLPHPEPTGDLAAPSEVTLRNLNDVAEGENLVLESENVIANNCITSQEGIRVLTCDDMLPIFAGGFLPAGTSCASPQLAALVPAEFKHIAVGLCGAGHTAESIDGSFTHLMPTDRGTAITEAPFEAFHDAFSEMNMYYHIDGATEWFRALGHPKQDTPLNSLTNVSMPKQSFMDCASTEMQRMDATDHDSGVESVQGCLEQYENDGSMAFAGFDNAFFMAGGQFADIFGFEDGGIFMGQGTSGDFSYDADVLYHEFGHAIVFQVGALQSGDLLDATGLNSSPGALNEAYADYFSSAITGDPVVGGYIGNILTGGTGIRTLNHNEQCPEYWAGQVHQDSHGWSAALWDARALYPQTEVDEVTGKTVRVFDRVAYEALTMLTTNMTQDDAARETIEAVKGEPLLEDAEGTLVTEAFTARNVIACERIRPLTTDTPIEMMFVAGVGGGGGMMGGGGPTYVPYAPPPVQFSIDLTKLDPSAECATFTAQLGQAQASSEDIPDMLGGGDSGQSAWAMSLLLNQEAPISFSYAGANVSAMPDNNEVSLTAVNSTSFTAFEAVIPFPADAQKLYLALVNRTEDGGVLGNIRITNVGENCPVDVPEDTTEVDADTDVGGTDTAGDAKATGDEGGCMAAGIPSVLWLLLAGLAIRRRRR
ncbi:MAG: hypothetical protein VX834_09985 [Myxococcota bacterium]|nr:hypothetical protein [Myxococcota bacterium]